MYSRCRIKMTNERKRRDSRVTSCLQHNGAYQEQAVRRVQGIWVSKGFVP